MAEEQRPAVQWIGLTRVLCVVVLLLMLAAIVYAGAIIVANRGHIGV
ncbi:MAG: hypothetical protein KC543_13915 [Myxococcales bacterium]|nr:hypothetical protein [Myxococcales bacterium]